MIRSGRLEHALTQRLLVLQKWGHERNVEWRNKDFVKGGKGGISGGLGDGSPPAGSEVEPQPPAVL